MGQSISPSGIFKKYLFIFTISICFFCFSLYMCCYHGIIVKQMRMHSRTALRQSGCSDMTEKKNTLKYKCCCQLFYFWQYIQDTVIYYKIQLQTLFLLGINKNLFCDTTSFCNISSSYLMSSVSSAHLSVCLFVLHFRKKRILMPGLRLQEPT